MYMDRNHFQRMTVSLGDHNINNTYNDARNIFRKLRRVVRYSFGSKLSVK
jgi:hypothetical protein